MNLNLNSNPRCETSLYWIAGRRHFEPFFQRKLDEGRNRVNLRCRSSEIVRDVKQKLSLANISSYIQTIDKEKVLLPNCDIEIESLFGLWGKSDAEAT